MLFRQFKANVRVKLAKTGHGPPLFHISCYLCFSVIICVVLLLFVLFYVLFVCKCVLPPGDNPIAVNKYNRISVNYNLHLFMAIRTKLICEIILVSRHLFSHPKNNFDTTASNTF